MSWARKLRPEHGSIRSVIPAPGPGRGCRRRPSGAWRREPARGAIGCRCREAEGGEGWLSPFIEHFADQAAYDAHTSSAVYRDLIAGQLASMIVEFTELDHELVAGF